jgi:hypothetical protein
MLATGTAQLIQKANASRRSHGFPCTQLQAEGRGGFAASGIARRHTYFHFWRRAHWHVTIKLSGSRIEVQPIWQLGAVRSLGVNTHDFILFGV